MLTRTPLRSPDAAASIATRYAAVRAQTLRLIRTLSPEDCALQSMPSASPAKWHLAHTTWFFDEFVLQASEDPRWRALFNSYYDSVGPQYARPQRGLLSRPSLAEVLDYRARIDDAMHAALARGDAVDLPRVELGLHHEQQHQELLLTDVKHAFSLNPLLPAFADTPAARGASRPLRFVAGPSGLVDIGHAGDGFAYDNETPRHRVFLAPHALADRAVTNAEFRAFVDDGGYREPRLWLSDGFARVRAEGWSRPLYWQDDLASEFTLGGVRAIDPSAPVCHVSCYETDAFARWAGYRLPTEFEWEAAASALPVRGNFVESGALHPRAPEAAETQMFGDVWEWTSSAYAPYPGYRPDDGALGEYNAKFMCGQYVLRGGSCASPAAHLRASYRNFFYPPDRWQFSGIRLARDA